MNQNDLSTRKYRVVVTKDHTFTFALDRGMLLIHRQGDDYPFPLSGRDTHALLNLLFDYRHDIYEANTEARDYAKYRGRQKTATSV